MSSDIDSDPLKEKQAFFAYCKTSFHLATKPSSFIAVKSKSKVIYKTCYLHLFGRARHASTFVKPALYEYIVLIYINTFQIDVFTNILVVREVILYSRQHEGET